MKRGRVLRDTIKHHTALCDRFRSIGYSRHLLIRLSLLRYSHGVTRAISAPTFKYGGFKGVSAGFLTGAPHALEEGAVWQDEVALHYTMTKTEKTLSLSAAVGLLQAKLIKAVKANETEELKLEERWLRRVVAGNMTLVVNVHSADLIASLLRVKADVEAEMRSKDDKASNGRLSMVIHDGAESWMLASALAEAHVGVVLAPFLAYSETWDQRRSLTGAPLTNGTAIDILHAAGVKVAIGTSEDWQTRNLYLGAGIAYTNGNGKINEIEALAFVSSNVYDMLGLKEPRDEVVREFVVFEGSPLEIDSRVSAVADGRGGLSVWT